MKLIRWSGVTDLRICAGVARVSYVANNNLQVAELPALIASVHASLTALGRPAEALLLQVDVRHELPPRSEQPGIVRVVQAYRAKRAVMSDNTQGDHGRDRSPTGRGRSLTGPGSEEGGRDTQLWHIGRNAQSSSETPQPPRKSCVSRPPSSEPGPVKSRHDRGPNGDGAVAVGQYAGRSRTRPQPDRSRAPPPWLDDTRKKALTGPANQPISTAPQAVTGQPGQTACGAVLIGWFAGPVKAFLRVSSSQGGGPRMGRGGCGRVRDRPAYCPTATAPSPFGPRS
jgi:hypothetical protein